LTFAAKYYALIGSYVALNSPDESISKYASAALIDVAFSDYIQGAFYGFFDFSDAGLLAYRAFSQEQYPQDVIAEIERTVFHSTIISIISQHLAPEFLDFVNARISKWEGLKEFFDDFIPLAEKEWKNKTSSELWQKWEDKSFGRPFSDVGKYRTFRFTALGVTWDFKWDNTYELTSVSEEFLAVLQIVLADLANTDLCLLRTTASVEIYLAATNKILIEPIPSNELIKYKVTIPLDKKQDYSDSEIFSIVSVLLSYVSLLPKDQFLNHLESALRGGLSSKTLFVQRYKTLYCRFIDASVFELSDRKSKSIPRIEHPFYPVLHHQLHWYSGPRPDYSEESTNELLQNRYNDSIVPIRHTLNRLLQSPLFIDTVAGLKKDGWLDWHILLSIALATVNYRINKKLDPRNNSEEYRHQFMDMLYQEEDLILEPVPLTEFTKDKLHFHLQISMISTLRGLGLESHQQTPNFNAISDFLGQRYNYWTDDIEHPNFGL